MKPVLVLSSGLAVCVVIALLASPQTSSLRDRLSDEARVALAKAEPTGVVHEVSLVAAPTTLPLLDGRSLEVWAYNEQVPGPTLRVRQGDRLRVKLTNALPQPTSVHWHGIRLPNPMDGVPGVTQPPVAPGETFTYDFVVPDAGTFWFHPHVRGSEQVERGLHGVLIVEPREPRSDAHELTWVLDDWRLDDTGAIDSNFVTRHDLSHDGRWGQVVTVNARVGQRFEVRAGQTVRLRLLNVANGRVFAPDFGGLDAQVVAFDGLSTARALPADRLVLAPGNRADVELSVPADAANQSFAIVDRFTRRPMPLASLDVSDAPAVAPAPTTSFARVPAWEGAHALEPDLEFRLNARRGGQYGLEWTINDQVMEHLEGDGAHATAPYRLETGRFTRLRFTNESARLHPMHLHGQFFKVLARNGQPVDEAHWRDTVLVRGRETVDVGVVPLDEGSWVLHCHILEHHDAGMMTVIAVNRQSTKSARAH